MISIHSPHARGDSAAAQTPSALARFQSTPLMRGETSWHLWDMQTTRQFQSTPLMRGETSEYSTSSSAVSISIHSPHARGDPKARCRTSKISYFNPLPSCEGRRAAWRRLPCGCRISIHSPHARGDLKDGGRFGRGLISIHSPHARGDIHNFFANNSLNNFNPLPSCEGRHTCLFKEPVNLIFQSTPLMRGETA